MGDISEMRGLVVAISFLGVFALLVFWIPPEFTTPPSLRNVATPEQFESIDVWSFAETYSRALNNSGLSIGNKYYVTNSGLDIGNRDFTFYYSKENLSEHEARMQLNWYYFIFPQAENLEWLNEEGDSRGETIDVTEMETDSDTENSTVNYRVKSNKWNFQYFASFSFNSTTYANFTHAWNFHGVYFFWAVNFDQVNTSYNVMNLISMLLFFQLPDVNIYVNAIMAIPLWACIIYLVYILVLRAIGAIFGGGA